MILPDFLIEHPDGEIRLIGRRISLYSVVRLYRDGNTAEQIAEELDLGLALVDKTLAFYLANQAEVDAYVDAITAELERQHAAYTPGPGILRLKRLKKLVEDADERYDSDPAWTSLTIVEKLQRLGALPPPNSV
jgi:uncharacterized protein (DUF433 family)